MSFKKQLLCVVFFVLISLVFAQKISVVVYADDAYPPYSYYENGIVKGIYTEILEVAFNRMPDYAVTIQAVPWPRGLAYLREGNGFALFPPYKNLERTFINPYSEPILEEKVVVFGTPKVMEKSRPVWPDDYFGLTIGINAGFTLGGEKFQQAVKDGRIKVEEAPDNRANILKLGLGRIDCYINDRVSILWELHRLKERNEFRGNDIVEGAFVSSEYGYLAFTNQDKGKFDYKDDFVKKFNQVIKEMKEKNEINAILNKYISSF